MTIFIRTLLLIISLGTLFVMLRTIRKSKLKIEYSIFWIIFLILLIIMAIFPQGVITLSKGLQFKSPENMVFLFVIFVLMVKIFYQTVEISNLEYKLEELIQKIAIGEYKDNEEDNID